jgi:armadillo repeat-containing protein 8
MTRASAPNALYELRNPSTAEAQVEALRQLKNEIVGHDQRKELIVRHGVVRPLARILEGGRRKSAKRRRTETNGHKAAGSSSRREEAWATEDEVRLQAVMVVGSLALGIVLRPFQLKCRVLTE